ncbi:MAG: beta strand repeat-containing protein, partial [Isosphaeraceae bacterium]
LGNLSAGNLSITQIEINRINTPKIIVGNPGGYPSDTGRIQTSANLSFANFSEGVELNSANVIDIRHNVASNGGIYLKANGLNVGAPISSSSGGVTIESRAGVLLNLGDGTDTVSGNMGLSQSEISNISFASSQNLTMIAGSIYNSDPITFTGNVALKSVAFDISQGGAGNLISLGNTTLTATGNIVLANATNDLACLTVTGSNITIADANNMTIGAYGISGKGNITLSAQNLMISGPINANGGNNTVTLLPTNGTAVNLGTKSAGVFGLSQADLSNITAYMLTIGNSSTGSVTVSTNLSWSSNMTLDSGQTISGTLSNFNRTFTQGSNVITATGTITVLGAVSGTQVTNANDSGNGSLRDVIANATGNATITFSSSLLGSTILLTSPIVINDSTGTITINGLGATQLTISGGNTTGLFEIRTPTVMQNLSIMYGNGANLTNGGAIFVNGTSLTLNNTSISNSTATNGGAIYVEATGQNLTINNSFIGFNNASNGGGFYVANGSLVVNTSTIAYNNASVDGGGIFGPSLSINKSTIAFNSAPNGNGGGLISTNPIYSMSSIIANNTANVSNNVNGSIFANYSLSNDWQNANSPGSPGNLTGDPMFGVLGLNGGTTRNISIANSTSPAVTGGSNAVLGTTDQRGFTFESNGIGAFAYQSTI